LHATADRGYCRWAVCEDGRVSRLLVIRHAQSAWNAAGRWQGWSDAPLSELGAKQAERAGRSLAAAGVGPGLVASSDLARAKRTAELIALEVGYRGSIAVDANLREQDLGEWNGLTREQIEARWPGAIAARDAGDLDNVPGGEPGAKFVERSLTALVRIAALGADQAVVVAHGGVIVALEKALGVWVESSGRPNLSGWWLEPRGTAPHVDLVPIERVELLAEGAAHLLAENVAERAETVAGPT